MTAGNIEKFDYNRLRERMHAEGWYVVSWGNNYHDSDRYSISVEVDDIADTLLLTFTPQEDGVHYYLELFLAARGGVGHSRHVITKGLQDHEPTSHEVGDFFIQGIEARAHEAANRSRNAAPPVESRGPVSIPQLDVAAAGEVQLQPSNVDLPLRIVREATPQLQRQFLTAQMQVLLRFGKMQLEQLGHQFYKDTAELAREVDILTARATAAERKPSGRGLFPRSIGVRSALFAIPVLLPALAITYLVAQQIIQNILSGRQVQLAALSFAVLAVVAIYVSALSLSRIPPGPGRIVQRYSKLVHAIPSVLIAPAMLAALAIGMDVTGTRLTPVLVLANIVALSVIVAEQRRLRGTDSYERPQLADVRAQYAAAAREYVAQADLLIANVETRSFEYVRETVIYETGGPWWELIDSSVDAEWLRTARTIATSGSAA